MHFPLTSDAWQAIGSMLQGIGTLGGAFAVWWIARRAVNDWRDQKQVEHQIQAAHTVMLAVHDLAHASRQNTYLFSKYGEILSKQDYTIVKRVIDCKDLERGFGNDVRKVIPISQTYFGSDVSTKLEKMQMQFELQISCFEDFASLSENGNDILAENVTYADDEIRTILSSAKKIDELKLGIEGIISNYIRKI